MFSRDRRNSPNLLWCVDGAWFPSSFRRDLLPSLLLRTKFLSIPEIKYDHVDFHIRRGTASTLEANHAPFTHLQSL